MIDFVTHNFILIKRKEIWFFDGEDAKNCAYTVYSVAVKRPDHEVLHLRSQLTNKIDLSLEKEDILAAMHPTTRYDIKRGEKLHLDVKTNFQPSAVELQQLIEENISFSKEKKISPVNFTWLQATTKHSCLCLRQIYLDETMLVTHIYLYDSKRAFLVHSFHNVNFKNSAIRGYANKFLHWKDMQLFKERGLSHYNWGGVDAIPQGIADFKSRFGGELIENYSYIESTLFARILINLYKRLFGNYN